MYLQSAVRFTHRQLVWVYHLLFYRVLPPTIYLGLRTPLFSLGLHPLSLLGLHTLFSFILGLRTRYFHWVYAPAISLGLRTRYPHWVYAPFFFYFWVYAPAIFIGFMHPLFFHWVYAPVIVYWVYTPVIFPLGLRTRCCLLGVHTRYFSLGLRTRYLVGSTHPLSSILGLRTPIHWFTHPLSSLGLRTRYLLFISFFLGFLHTHYLLLGLMHPLPSFLGVLYILLLPLGFFMDPRLSFGLPPVISFGTTIHHLFGFTHL
jgi:hypothetical protein